MTTLFLSYARGDDEPFVRRLYNDLCAHGFDVWFDRVKLPSRGLTFHSDIVDARESHEHISNTLPEMRVHRRSLRSTTR